MHSRPITAGLTVGFLFAAAGASSCVTRTVYVVDDRPTTPVAVQQQGPVEVDEPVAEPYVEPQGVVAYEDDAGISDPYDFVQPLMPYGSWVQYPGYGLVFVPSQAVVGRSFRPYTHGHWEHTEWGWTWVDHHPFGWATGHYGRWFYDASYGWVWVPGTQWSPAWVSWRTGGGYIGWTAMPPGSVYGGSYTVYDSSWVFVRTSGFGATYVGGVLITGSAYRTCYYSTAPSRTTVVVYGRNYYRGPDYDQVRRETRVIHRPIRETERDRPVTRPPAGTVVSRDRDRGRDRDSGRDDVRGRDRDGNRGGDDVRGRDRDGTVADGGRDTDSRGRDRDGNTGSGRDRDGNTGAGRDRDGNTGNGRDRDGNTGRNDDKLGPRADGYDSPRPVDVGQGNDRYTGRDSNGRDGNTGNGRDGNTGNGRDGNTGNGRDRDTGSDTPRSDPRVPRPIDVGQDAPRYDGNRGNDRGSDRGAGRDDDNDGVGRGTTPRADDRYAPRPVDGRDVGQGNDDDNGRPDLRGGGLRGVREDPPKKTYVDDPSRFPQTRAPVTGSSSGRSARPTPSPSSGRAPSARPTPQAPSSPRVPPPGRISNQPQRSAPPPSSSSSSSSSESSKKKKNSSSSSSSSKSKSSKGKSSKSNPR